MTYQGSAYIALLPSTGVHPTSDPNSVLDWAVLAPGGTAGATGATGSSGVQGAQGSQGVQGVQGVIGATGAQGVAGASGATGAAGVLGATGVQGIAGATGALGPTGSTGITGPTGGTTVAVTGQSLAVWGDSHSTNFESPTWMAVATQRNGAVFAVQDARPARDLLHWFEQYQDNTPGTPLSALGPYSTAALGGGYNGNNSNLTSVGETTGNTLAQNLAGVKMLVWQFGTNDARAMNGQLLPSSPQLAMGELGDSTSSGTFFGNMEWVYETFQAANPTMRIVVVGPMHNSFIGDSQMQTLVNAQIAWCASKSIPYLNLFANSGVNSVTSGTLTTDGTHISAVGQTSNVGPAIANFINQWF